MTKQSNNNITPKQRWKEAVKKFERATKPEEGEFIDSVKVRIVGSTSYLAEIAQGKQFHSDDLGITREYSMLRMSPNQLKKNQLIYDESSGALRDNNNNYATTIGQESKGIEDLQAFVMGKDGSLYTATHTGILNEHGLTLSHASFLSGRPAEMAGLMGINDKGKIFYISDNSGHYSPELLDMYRGVKKLQETMPFAFEPDAQIEVRTNNGHHLMPIDSFITAMEKETNHQPYHQILRNERIQKYLKYQDDLKNAVSLKIDSRTDDLPDAIANLNDKQKKELTKGFNSSMFIISISDPNGKFQTVNLTSLTHQIIENNRGDALKTLLDAGITNKNSLHNALHEAVYQQKAELVKTMLDNPTIQESLVQEMDSKAYTTLDLAARSGNVKIIKEILKYPEGLELLSKVDPDGMNPIEAAKDYGHIDAEKILAEAHKELEQQNTFLTKNFGSIQLLSAAGIDPKMLLRILKNDPNKTEFLLESAIEIKFFAEDGVPSKTIIQIYDKDPNLARLVVSEEDAIIELVKNKNISPEDLTKCNHQQMRNLIDSKISPDAFKSLVNPNAHEDKLKNILKNANISENLKTHTSQTVSDTKTTVKQNAKKPNISI